MSTPKRSFLSRRTVGVLLTLALPVPVVAATTSAAEAGRPTCAGFRATIVGTGKGETIRGTARRDVIVARGGHDRISAGGGDDVICAGAGNDWIDAGAGRDVVKGGAGSDVILGGAGKDRLSGDGGDDRIDGGPGRDRVAGGAGRDVCGGESSDCEVRLPVRHHTPSGTPSGTPTGDCPATVCKPNAYPTRWVVDVKGHEVRTTDTSEETTDWEATVVLVAVGDPKAPRWWQQESGSGSYHSKGHSGQCATGSSGVFDTFTATLGLVPAQGAYYFSVDAGGPGTITMTCPGNEMSGDGYFDGWAATGGGPVPVPWDPGQSPTTGSWHEDGDHLDRDTSWVITPR